MHTRQLEVTTCHLIPEIGARKMEPIYGAVSEELMVNTIPTEY